MSSYETQADLEMSADTLWSVIEDFGDVSWLPGEPEPVFEGEGIGMIRSVVIPPLPTAREQLDRVDQEARQIHYHVIDGNPMPVRDYSASMQVVELEGGRSRLVWRSTWEPDGVSEEDARKAVARLYAGVLLNSKKNFESRESR